MKEINIEYKDKYLRYKNLYELQQKNKKKIQFKEMIPDFNQMGGKNIKTIDKILPIIEKVTNKNNKLSETDLKEIKQFILNSYRIKDKDNLEDIKDQNDPFIQIFNNLGTLSYEVLSIKLKEIKDRRINIKIKIIKNEIQKIQNKYLRNILEKLIDYNEKDRLKGSRIRDIIQKIKSNDKDSIEESDEKNYIFNLRTTNKDNYDYFLQICSKIMNINDVDKLKIVDNIISEFNNSEFNLVNLGYIKLLLDRLIE